MPDEIRDFDDANEAAYNYPTIFKDCEQEEYGRVAAQRADGWCELAL